MFLVIMPRVSASPRRFDNPEHPRSGEIPGGDALDGEDRSSQCDEDLLSAGYANDDCRNVFRINEGVEIFRARQIRKMDDAVGNLGDFASELFARSQVQLHTFADAALNDAKHGGVRLQGSFFLGEQT